MGAIEGMNLEIPDFIHTVRILGNPAVPNVLEDDPPEREDQVSAEKHPFPGNLGIVGRMPVTVAGCGEQLEPVPSGAMGVGACSGGPWPLLVDDPEVAASPGRTCGPDMRSGNGVTPSWSATAGALRRSAPRGLVVVRRKPPPTRPRTPNSSRLSASPLLSGPRSTALRR